MCHRPRGDVRFPGCGAHSEDKDITVPVLGEQGASSDVWVALRSARRGKPPSGSQCEQFLHKTLSHCGGILLRTTLVSGPDGAAEALTAPTHTNPHQPTPTQACLQQKARPHPAHLQPQPLRPTQGSASSEVQTLDLMENQPTFPGECQPRTRLTFPSRRSPRQHSFPRRNAPLEPKTRLRTLGLGEAKTLLQADIEATRPRQDRPLARSQGQTRTRHWVRNAACVPGDPSSVWT